MEWQDIESAPKDGTIIDLWATFKEGSRRVPDAYYDTGKNDWKLNGFSSRQYAVAPIITHWMPAPLAPSDAK